MYVVLFIIPSNFSTFDRSRAGLALLLLEKSSEDAISFEVNRTSINDKPYPYASLHGIDLRLIPFTCSEMKVAYHITLHIQNHAQTSHSYLKVACKRCFL